MSTCSPASLISEIDRWLGYIEQCVAHEVELEEKFLEYVQRSETERTRLAEMQQEKARLEDVLSARTKECAAKANKLIAAMSVVQHERRLREQASAQRDQVKENFDRLCAQLPEHRVREVEARVSLHIEAAAAASTNTDIDVTTDSTFFSSCVAPSSGVESDYSPPAAAHRTKASCRTVTKSTGFTPIKASSLRQSTDRLNDNFSLGTECSLVSSIPSTLISEDSRRSAVFYSTILEHLKNRPHAFNRKTFVLGEHCAACDLKIACGKRALLCNDCRCIAHEKCSEKVVKPCIPVNDVMRHSRLPKSIHDYTPRFAPFVPAIVVHCVLQVEERGLSTPGLYKVSTFDRTVDDLKHQYGKDRGIPNLAHVDVLAICQFLKDFFISLKPALISKEIFQNLLQFFEPLPVSKITFEMVFNSANKFDSTCRDTLVFLILHLQNVAGAEAVNMTPRRLSKIFTPLLVDGYKKGVFQEEKRKCKLLEKFIELPSDYWKVIFVKDL